MSFLTKKPQTTTEMKAAIAELKPLEKELEEQERANQERKKAIQQAAAEVEKLLPGRTQEILDAYHKLQAAELEADAARLARRQLEFELIDPVAKPPAKPPASPQLAEKRAQARAQARHRLYQPLPAPWHR